MKSVTAEVSTRGKTDGGTAASDWYAGVAAVNITPREPIAMAGWAGRRISDGIAQEIFVRYLALRDANGRTCVLVSSDLLGLSRELSEELAQRAQAEFGLSRHQIIFNSSHNHAGPTVGGLLHLYHELSAQELRGVERYTASLLDRMTAGIGIALANLSPARLSFEQGLCGFAVNRRRDVSARAEYSHARELPQVVDHDVPVLAVRSPQGSLRAVVFGYACHPTSIYNTKISGDWPGVAQETLQHSFPEAHVMFVAGCGGDQNPLPRYGRFHEELTQLYGRLLAACVVNVLDREMQPLQGELRCGFEEITLALKPQPTSEELEHKLKARLPTESGLERRALIYQLARLETQGSLDTGCPYPIHVWEIGGLLFIGLSGEPVVDFSLGFKKRFGADRTWVAGYCNELTAYIPSLRVLREGGYEGTEGMLEDGWPAPFGDDVEGRIAAAVERLAANT